MTSPGLEQAIYAVVAALLALILCPLVVGVTVRTQAVMGGRRGAPLLQRYRDLAKLMRKGAVISTTTSAVFRASPIISLAGVLVALLMVPLGGVPAVVHFRGDLFVVMGLLGLGRFVTMLGALDTGSPFEGMGASREAHFGALAEPVTFFTLAVAGRMTQSASLTEIAARTQEFQLAQTLPVIMPILVALVIIFLVENSRMPVDDPTTHLELTMIHEVMVLDHSGPELAFIEYGAALKQWLLGAIIVGFAVPFSDLPLSLDLVLGLLGLVILAVGIGLVESLMARLRLISVPGLIASAGAAAMTALLMSMLVTS